MGNSKILELGKNQPQEKKLTESFNLIHKNEICVLSLRNGKKKKGSIDQKKAVEKRKK